MKATLNQWEEIIRLAPNMIPAIKRLAIAEAIRSIKDSCFKVNVSGNHKPG